MKNYLKLTLMGFAVAGLQLNLKADNLKLTSPYPEEKVSIDYSGIFNPGDMDGD